MLLVVVTASAQESSVHTRASVYQDDDYTTVFTAAIDANGVIEETVGLRAGYLVDVTSSASIDVVTAATDRWEERRDEFRAGADVYAGNVIVTADYVHSLEPDWSSHRINGGFSIDLADRATTLAIGGGVILNDVGRSGEDQTEGRFSESQTTFAANLRWVQVLDPESLMQLGYAGQIVTGYQASPYRYVRLTDGSTYPETHPSERHRHALVFRYRRALSETVALALDERVYLDSWGIFGTTTIAGVTIELAERVELELRDRFHFQTGASFYEPSYSMRKQYLSIDRELTPSIDNHVGPAFVFTFEEAGPFEELVVDASASFFFYRYFEFEPLPWRFGFTATLGFGGTFL
jgi:hypothetical protein